MNAILHRSLPQLLVSGPLALVLTAGFLAAQTALDEESPWPRVRTTNGHTVTLHQTWVGAMSAFISAFISVVLHVHHHQKSLHRLPLVTRHPRSHWHLRQKSFLVRWIRWRKSHPRRIHLLIRMGHQKSHWNLSWSNLLMDLSSNSKSFWCLHQARENLHLKS